VRFEHSPGTLAHRFAERDIREQFQKHLSKFLVLAGLDNEAALVMVNEPGDFPSLRTDRDDRAACGGNTIEFAWDNQTFELGP
jgi:hypothetical protein